MVKYFNYTAICLAIFLMSSCAAPSQPSERQKEFEKYYAGLKNHYEKVSYSSNPRDYLDCEDYRKIIKKGFLFIPFIIEKMDKGDFFLNGAMDEITFADIHAYFDIKTLGEQDTSRLWIKWWDENKREYYQTIKENEGCISKIEDKAENVKIGASGLDPIETGILLCNLQEAIASGDREKTAELIGFPAFKTGINGKFTGVNEKEFLKHYDEIMNSKIRKVIMNQKYEDLWGTWQGVCVGKKGEIWISKYRFEGQGKKPVKVKIVTINNE